MTSLEGIRQASRVLRSSNGETRSRVLQFLEESIQAHEGEILVANKKDLDSIPGDASAAFRDRLTLDLNRLSGIRESLSQVSKLDDPIGEVVEDKVLKNGLHARRVRSPLGVIFMIFESRPNVALEAFSLALKSGNALILRGGKESRNTTEVFYRLIRESLVKTGLPLECFFGITDPDRAIVAELLTRKNEIDVVVPRGGDSLIRFVTENSKIPIIKNDRGLCHIYVHDDADLDQALLIIENSKTQRPGVCNAMETLLVSRVQAEPLLSRLSKNIPQVKFHACPESFPILFKNHPNSPQVVHASEADYDREYLDLEMSVKVVSGLDEAISHIEKHSSRHSEAILTKSEAIAKRFENEVDAAAVYWNASTRFTDGFELGLGGELGISTQKLHVRGPVGLRELTSIRWIIEGTGQVRN